MAIASLFLSMQVINLISLPLLLTPLALHTLGVQTQLSRKYDYMYSIEQFIPDFFVKMWFYGNLPVQTLQTPLLMVYFPGVAIECILGTLQGIILGLDLLWTPRRGNYQTPYLPSANLLFYAGMCISAIFLHCFKDVPMFDITSVSMLTQSLFWVDTFCTGCVPPIMLLTGLIECGFLQPCQQRQAWKIMVFNGFLTWLGVFQHQRWATFFLHVLYQSIFLFPLLRITGQRVRDLGCPHGYAYMKFSKICSLIFCYSAFLFASPLSSVTHGVFCPLTSAFLGCRIGMVQYWVYCKKVSECDCAQKKKSL